MDCYFSTIFSRCVIAVMSFVAMEKEVCPMYYICTTFMEKKFDGLFDVDRLTGTVGQR